MVYMYSYRSSNMYRASSPHIEDVTSKFLTLFGKYTNDQRNDHNSSNNNNNISEKSTCNPVEFIFTIVDHLPSLAMSNAIHSLMHCRAEVLLFQSSWIVLMLTYLWCLVSTSQINVVVAGQSNEKDVKST